MGITNMLDTVLNMRLSVLQVILITVTFLGAYSVYKLVMRRISENSIWSFVVQLVVTIVASYLFFQIMQMKN